MGEKSITVYEYEGTPVEIRRLPGSFTCYADERGRYFRDMGDGRFVEDTEPSGSGVTLYESIQEDASRGGDES